MVGGKKSEPIPSPAALQDNGTLGKPKPPAKARNQEEQEKEGRRVAKMKERAAAKRAAVDKSGTNNHRIMNRDIRAAAFEIMGIPDLAPPPITPSRTERAAMEAEQRRAAEYEATRRAALSAILNSNPAPQPNQNQNGAPIPNNGAKSRDTNGAAPSPTLISTNHIPSADDQRRMIDDAIDVDKYVEAKNSAAEINLALAPQRRHTGRIDQHSEDELIELLSRGYLKIEIARMWDVWPEDLWRWISADDQRAARVLRAVEMAAEAWDAKAAELLKTALPHQQARARDIATFLRWRAETKSQGYKRKQEVNVTGGLSLTYQAPERAPILDMVAEALKPFQPPAKMLDVDVSGDTAPIQPSNVSKQAEIVKRK